MYSFESCPRVRGTGTDVLVRVLLPIIGVPRTASTAGRSAQVSQPRSTNLVGTSHCDGYGGGLRHQPGRCSASILWAVDRVYKPANPGFVAPLVPRAHRRVYRLVNPGFRACMLSLFAQCWLWSLLEIVSSCALRIWDSSFEWVLSIAVTAFQSVSEASNWWPGPHS